MNKNNKMSSDMRPVPDLEMYLIILKMMILLCVLSCVSDMLDGTRSVVRMSNGPGPQPPPSRYWATGTSLGTDAGSRLPRKFSICQCHREPPESCKFQTERSAPKGKRVNLCKFCYSASSMTPSALHGVRAKKFNLRMYCGSGTVHIIAAGAGRTLRMHSPDGSTLREMTSWLTSWK